MSSTEQFVKVRVAPEHFMSFMQAFLDGVRSGGDFELELDGEECRFPAGVLERSNLDLEYERKPEKTELEVTVEWRHEST